MYPLNKYVKANLSGKSGQKKRSFANFITPHESVISLKGGKEIQYM